jgi:hypothetical protein
MFTRGAVGNPFLSHEDFVGKCAKDNSDGSFCQMLVQFLAGDHYDKL